MTGILYGVGVGPGDPELMTLKAVRVLRECQVIFTPGSEPTETVAWKIAAASVPEIGEKEVLGVKMPMTRDPEELETAHENAAQKIIGLLRQGKNIAFLTLGDPCIYSTCLYVHRRVRERGFQAELINGIPSFLAASAALGEGLVEKEEMLHLIPASYPVGDALGLPGTKVLMKAGRAATRVIESLKVHSQEVRVVERCGMEGEKIYTSAEDVPENLSYYTIIVAKERGEH